MLENENNTRQEYIRSVALQMMAAARTAPKSRGVDNLEITVATGETKDTLATRMEELAPVTGHQFFVRDAGNIRKAGAVVLIGTRIGVMGLDCGFCGFATCAEKLDKELVPCVFNTNDMGIAVGSAVSKAADCRVDSRVMYSAGFVAIEMGLIPGCTAVLAIPVSVSGKSPFFDRPSVVTPPISE